MRQGKDAPFRSVQLLPRCFAATSGFTPLHSASLPSLPPSHCRPRHAPAPPPHVYICKYWLHLQLLPFVNLPFTFGNMPYRPLWGIFLAPRIWFHVKQWLYLVAFATILVSICKFSIYICKCILGVLLRDFRMVMTDFAPSCSFVKTHGRSPCHVQLGRTAPHPLSKSHPTPSGPANYPNKSGGRFVRPFATPPWRYREALSQARSPHCTPMVSPLRPPAPPRFPWMLHS